MREDLGHWLSTARVVVCLGSGGVGKTTTAAALAIAAATAGLRVAVLTVDPAARLKDALDLPPRAGELHRVPLPDSRARLDAMLLDAKGLFDELVRRVAPSPALAARILANPVYRNIAGAFAGSDAYMALEQVLDVSSSHDYDLVVVDTPPASHALELFDAPERVLRLLESRALEYLEEPARILGVATSRLARGLLAAVLTVLERLTGLSLLSDVSTLAVDFGAVAPAFRGRARAIHDLLRASSTRYLLVATPEPHRVADLLGFAAEVERLGVRCDAVAVNRMLAIGMPRSREDTERTIDAPALHPWPPSLTKAVVDCARDLERLRASQQRAVSDLRAGLEQRDRLCGTPTELLWLELPATTPPPTTLAGVVALAGSFAQATQPATTTAA